jgi:hypothetical protein
VLDGVVAHVEQKALVREDVVLKQDFLGDFIRRSHKIGAA